MVDGHFKFDEQALEIGIESMTFLWARSLGRVAKSSPGFCTLGPQKRGIKLLKENHLRTAEL